MSDEIHPGSLRRTAWLVGLLALVFSISTVSLVHHYGATRPTIMDSNRTHAAKTLGISLRTLRNKINEFTAAGIQVMEPTTGKSL